jgi:myo-inositol-1(or 4)-monophosphatase
MKHKNGHDSDMSFQPENKIDASTDPLFQDEEKKRRLIHAVQRCSDYAVEQQRHIVRDYKQDGTVLTHTDIYINTYMKNIIQELYPSCAVITEEERLHVDADAPYTFVLDPIDGTDVYSQGMPCWCIAVGILDRSYAAVGAIVSAPRWGIGTTDGLFLHAFPGSRVRHNGAVMPAKGKSEDIKQMVVCSGTHKSGILNGFSGKIRSFGSNILHILSPAVHSSIDAAVFAPSYIWDIAPAHGILQGLNFDILYRDGKPLDYRKLLDRSRSTDYACAAHKETLIAVMNMLQ